MAIERAHILVVDDDRQNGEFLAEQLSREECRVSAFRDPREALKHFRKGAFQVGILDLRMPQMSGVDLFHRLREKDPDIGLIILTGYPSVNSVLATLKKGAYDYVKKPYRIAELKAVVYRLLEEKGFFFENDLQINKRIGARIREARTKRDWTLAQLASHTQLSKSLISQLENGKNCASLFSLTKIARRLGVPVANLVQDI